MDRLFLHCYFLIICPNTRHRVLYQQYISSEGTTEQIHFRFCQDGLHFPENESSLLVSLTVNDIFIYLFSQESFRYLQTLLVNSYLIYIFQLQISLPCQFSQDCYNGNCRNAQTLFFLCLFYHQGCFRVPSLLMASLPRSK